MEPPAFRAVVHEVIAALPPKFRDIVDRLLILIEDTPRQKEDRNLLGLYEGVPVTEWDADYSGKMPDTISLYKENIERAAGSAEEVPHVIRETLLHEIAHHFGFEHDAIDRMEERWKHERK